MLANFWTFPLTPINSVEDIQGNMLNIKPVVHIFTHRRWEIWLVKSTPIAPDSRQQYFSQEELAALSLPKLQYKLLEKLHVSESEI